MMKKVGAILGLESTGIVPTPVDIADVRVLFVELDPESQEWYGFSVRMK
jgi:hypothetical protein